MSTPSRRTFLRLAQGAMVAAAFWAGSADAQQRPAAVVFENVRIQSRPIAGPTQRSSQAAAAC